MERLSFRQKQVYDELLAQKDKFNMSVVGKKLGVSRQAILDRLHFMVKKGYVKQVEGVYKPTGDGLDSVLKTGGKTKRTYYESTENWRKTLSADGFSQAVETGDEQEQDRVGDSIARTPATT